MVLLLGPRQCGKTTLARAFAARHDAEYFDLQAPLDLKLRRALVVHPGQKSFPLEDWAEAVAITHLRERLLALVHSLLAASG